jgi:hypothetical protein
MSALPSTVDLATSRVYPSPPRGQKPAGPAEAAPADVVRAGTTHLPRQKLDLERALADGLAVLWVQSLPDNGWQAFGASEDAGSYEAPPFFPEKSIRDELLSPLGAWQAMNVLSDELPDLADWFRQVRDAARRAGRDPSLVIFDASDPAVPWEMFRLHPTDPEALGTEVRAVRWLPGMRSHVRRELALPERSACSGAVLSHFDPEVSGGAEVQPWLEPLLELNPTPERDIQSFRGQLRKAAAEVVGLVYCLCHADVPPGSFKLWFGADGDKQQRLFYSDLLALPMPLFESSDCIVFLNACEAGAAGAERRFIGGSVLSLARLFLQKGARGFIGATDRTLDVVAARVAHDFVNQVQGGGGPVPVAQVLQELRKEVFRNLPEQPSETDPELEQWYYTSRYVFYGHPETTLRLRRKGAGG